MPLFELSVQISPVPPKSSNFRASALPRIGKKLAFSVNHLTIERGVLIDRLNFTNRNVHAKAEDNEYTSERAVA
jgi:hypothetical protein